MGNYQVALADYEQSIRLNPKNAHTYFNRGLAYYRLKKRDLACKDFEKACEMGDCDGTNWARREGLCQASLETPKLSGKARRVAGPDTPLILKGKTLD